MGPVLPETKIYLIYIVLDASGSMRWDPVARRVKRTDLRRTPLGQFTRLISQMLLELSEDSIVNTIASVSVLAFNDNPQILRRMSTLDEPAAIATPHEGQATDYAKVLRLLVRQHPHDVRIVAESWRRQDITATVAAPWVYFITDGRPYADGEDQLKEDWLPHRDSLVSGPIGARIVAMGLPGADEDTLLDLATGDDNDVRNALVAEAGVDPNQLAESVAKAIQDSITKSAGLGTLTIAIPAGMRRARRWRQSG